MKKNVSKGVAAKPKLFDYLKKYDHDDELLTNELITYLVGGSHTSANLLLWAVIFLA